MRISWYSNHPDAPTGYGTQTAQIVPRLAAAGHDLAILSNFGVMGFTSEWNGIPVFQQGKDKYSNDVVAAHHAAHRGDWIITLYDVWPFVPESWQGMRIVSWVPIDHTPPPPPVTEWCRHVLPIAMSRWGQDQLRQQGVIAEYAPHSIDLTVFKPTEQMREQSPRTMLQVPDDALLVMINAANIGWPARKAWPEMFIALANFMARHDDVYAYFHTDRTGIGGLDLPLLARAAGLKPNRTRWADPYGYFTSGYSQQDLAALYTSADVLLSTSMGEGFGLAVVEAQACGTPVIVSDFSAQPELVGAGWKVPGQPWWDPTQQAFQVTPYIGQILDRLEQAYNSRGSVDLREQALAKAAEYETGKVFEENWKPILAKMEERLTEEAKPPNRAARRRMAKGAKRAA